MKGRFSQARRARYAIREGDPPSVAPSLLRVDQSAEMKFSLSQWIGHASLFCAGVCWLGMPIVLVSDMTAQRGFLRDVTMISVMICWWLAVLGGSLSTLFGWSKTGCLAMISAILGLMALVGLAYLIGPVWLD